MPFQKYINAAQKQYKSGIAGEHAYRPALQNLLEDLIPDVLATNDPKKIKCGAPDFILSRNKIHVGYIEAKDIGINLDKEEKSDQLNRYRTSLDNLILTDYMEFRLYRYSERVETISIAEIQGKDIKLLPENIDHLKRLLIDFASFSGQTIKSSKKLAEMMAHKARLMRDVFYKIVKNTDEESSLHDQLKAFQLILVHDMDEEQFADVYAQTLAYGLFTARLHDKTPEDFSREEALYLIPKTNPFLRQLFVYVAGPDLDDRIVWMVDALCEVFRATDLKAILKDFGSGTGQKDPILHFYETFLKEYDKSIKDLRGVWYTPESVVNFIVRAIDEVLKNHFQVKEGICDKSKIMIEVEAQETDKRTKTGRKMSKRKVHKIQLLDVATGTGTFLAEVIKQISKCFKGQEGIWVNYLENDLLPRLHGFELLMASYAMCHMKLDLLLQEIGLKPSNTKRVSVYLTNSLEEHHPEIDTLFASWLSREANDASWIKKNMPIMVAFGNPPYNGESINKSDWIMGLMDSYKQEPSGGKLQEQNIKWINNDYAKFIRMGESFIQKNGKGILAYITSHSYLDGPIFRGMRYHLLNTFDDIYIIDLHGNAQKNETAPDGTADNNVFDILEGVSIIIAAKHSKHSGKKPLANLHHFDLFGERQSKYDFLFSNQLSSIPFKKLDYQEPYYFFVPKNFSGKEEYEKGFSITEIFPVHSVGIATARDKLTIHYNEDSLVETIKNFSSLSTEDARKEYNLKKDVRDWKVAWAQKDLSDSKLSHERIKQISYRPFDKRWTYYTGKTKGFHCMPRPEVMEHMLAGSNIGLLTSRMTKGEDFAHVFVSTNITEVIHLSSKTSNNAFLFPLYTFNRTLENLDGKAPNLDPKIYSLIEKAIPDVTPELLFNYIYAVLHSSAYRLRYSEFLKIEFPRVPYPTCSKVFHALAEQGAKLIELHMMRDKKLDTLITNYPAGGDHKVEKFVFEDGKVWINGTQFFGKVPKVAWEFYIGGYQPAQKWLKDRKGRSLTIDEIAHWQKIIVALVETDKIMKEIDTIEFLPA